MSAARRTPGPQGIVRGDRRGRGRSPALVATGALLAAGAMLLWFTGRGTIPSSPEELRVLVAGSGAWAPLAFFVAQVAQVVLAPVPGTATVAVGAALFGPWEGLALGLSGAVVGSVAVFALTRRYGLPLAARLVGEGAVGRYAGVSGAGGWWFFAVLAVPFFPDDVLCVLAGLSAVPFRRFLVFVVLGRLPGTAITALAAADLTTHSAGAWAAAGLVVLVGLALLARYRGRLESRLLRLPAAAARGRRKEPDGALFDDPPREAGARRRSDRRAHDGGNAT